MLISKDIHSPIGNSSHSQASRSTAIATLALENISAVKATALSSLPVGTRGVLRGYSGLNAQDAALVEAMGLREDCSLQICRQGEPCIVRIDCARIGLSSSIARELQVSPQ